MHEKHDHVRLCRYMQETAIVLHACFLHNNVGCIHVLPVLVLQDSNLTGCLNTQTHVIYTSHIIYLKERQFSWFCRVIL